VKASRETGRCFHEKPRFVKASSETEVIFDGREGMIWANEGSAVAGSPKCKALSPKDQGVNATPPEYSVSGG